MKSRIVSVGNSKGVRIPKLLLEQTGLVGDVEIEADGDSLVIRPAKKVRAGWEEAAKKMAANGEDELIIPDDVSLTAFDEEEWEWPPIDSTSTSSRSTRRSEVKSKKPGRASSSRPKK